MSRNEKQNYILLYTAHGPDPRKTSRSLFAIPSDADADAFYFTFVSGSYLNHYPMFEQTKE
jgi:hypothetical protein